MFNSCAFAALAGGKIMGKCRGNFVFSPNSPVFVHKMGKNVHFEHKNGNIFGKIKINPEIVPMIFPSV